MIQKKNQRTNSKAKDKCNHSLSYKSTMRTLKTTSDAYIRQCTVCGKREILPRYRGSTNNLLLRNSFRARYGADLQAKDIMQPYQAGKPNPEFAKAYPDRAGDYYTKKELKKLGMEKIKSKKSETS